MADGDKRQGMQGNDQAMVEMERIPGAEAHFSECDLSNVLQYLTMIQSVIDRMANSSLAIKAACVALAAGSLAAAGNVAPMQMLIVVAAICLAFALFDAKYLQQERSYRGLYERVAKRRILESLSLRVPTPSFEDKSNYSACFLSWSELGFYGVLFAVAAFLFIICRQNSLLI